MTIHPDNKALYDENWAEWEAIKRIGPMSRHTQRLVQSELKKLRFSSILDIGCGPGVFLSLVQQNFPRTTLAGSDLSSSAIDLARKNVPQGVFWQLDIAKEKPQERYDLITMIDVAEHITDDVTAFENLRPACKGHLLVVTLEGRMRDFEPHIGHVRNYQPGELQTKLGKAGYKVVKYRHWGWPLYSPLYRNASKSIDAHNRRISSFQRFFAKVAYRILFFNWPNKGDLVIAIAQPQ